MTTRVRRWTRRCEQNDLSYRMAAVRRHVSADMGTESSDLLGQSWL
jgi:hypothetical protein